LVHSPPQTSEPLSPQGLYCYLNRYRVYGVLECPEGVVWPHCKSKEI
jgi:hypothetical protein